jgi:hypothetical protein
MLDCFLISVDSASKKAYCFLISVDRVFVLVFWASKQAYSSFNCLEYRSDHFTCKGTAMLCPYHLLHSNKNCLIAFSFK